MWLTLEEKHKEKGRKLGLQKSDFSRKGQFRLALMHCGALIVFEQFPAFTQGMSHCFGMIRYVTTLLFMLELIVCLFSMTECEFRCENSYHNLIERLREDLNSSVLIDSKEQ
jgi:hypothetical protein